MRDIEAACAEEREERHLEKTGEALPSKRLVVGVPRLFATDPRTRPANPKATGPQPLCHASTREAYWAYVREYRDFCREHRKASIDYLAGYHEREFPEGSFRPPITTIYQASRLSTP